MIWAFESPEVHRFEHLSYPLRFRLDLTGWRISRADWQGLSLDARQALTRAARDADDPTFVSCLRGLVATAQPCPPVDAARYDDPRPVADLLQTVDVTLTPEVWQKLPSCGRFALTRLSASPDNLGRILLALSQDW